MHWNHIIFKTSQYATNITHIYIIITVYLHVNRYPGIQIEKTERKPLHSSPSSSKPELHATQVALSSHVLQSGVSQTIIKQFEFLYDQLQYN